MGGHLTIWNFDYLLDQEMENKGLLNISKNEDMEETGAKSMISDQLPMREAAHKYFNNEQTMQTWGCILIQYYELLFNDKTIIHFS